MKRLLVAAALAALPTIALADAAEDAIEARHGFYKMLGLNMATLAGMAKGEIAYDEAVASRAGQNIEALTHYDLPSLFIDGTSADDNKESNALPALWQNKDDFAAKFADLQKAATGVGEAVKGGQDKVGPVVQTLGGACKACHDKYRKPES